MGVQFQDYLLKNIRPSIKINTEKTSSHTAIIAKGNRILCVAVNQFGYGHSRHTIHAEVNVIRELGDLSLLRHASLYVWRLTKAEEPTNSKPCSRCMRFLKKCQREYGLGTIYYTSKDEPLFLYQDDDDV